ncbi:MAG: RNA polymerase sigma factor [Bacteroidota bacterium]
MQNDSADIILWSAFKNGDREAFSVLFHRYYPLLLQYGSKIVGDPRELEDCIHDLFIELWKSKAGTDIISVKAYLLKSLKYKLYKLGRQRLPLQSSDAGFETMTFEISHDDFLVQKEEERSKSRLVISAINQLPPRQKEMVYLRIFKGLQYEEISDIMNISYQATRNLFYQSVKSLRQLLPRK